MRSVPEIGHPSPTITLTRENVSHYRSELTRMSRRYAQLTWAASAVEQRERAEMQKPLMDLYRVFHPKTIYTQFDDIDMVLRENRQPQA